MRILRVTKQYERSDIITIPVPPDILEVARSTSVLLDKENEGKYTRDGGADKNIKGYLGQWAVHTYLNSCNNGRGWYHLYSEPYVKGQHGDKFDILFGGTDKWDVKCREFWTEEYFYNIKMIMSEHERDESKPCDAYIFCTPDLDYKNIYILGGNDYHYVWNNLTDIPEEAKSHLKFPAAGYVISRTLTPIEKLILH